MPQEKTSTRHKICEHNISMDALAHVLFETSRFEILFFRCLQSIYYLRMLLVLCSTLLLFIFLNLCPFLLCILLYTISLQTCCFLQICLLIFWIWAIYYLCILLFFIISLLACILFIIVLNFTVNIVTCWHVYLFLYCDLGQYAISFIDFLSVNIVVQFLTVSMVFSCYSVVQDIVFYSSCSLVRSLAGNCF